MDLADGGAFSLTGVDVPLVMVSIWSVGERRREDAYLDAPLAVFSGTCRPSPSVDVCDRLDTLL